MKPCVIGLGQSEGPYCGETTVFWTKRRAEAATPRPDKRRARGRIEHTLLDGACRRHPNRPKTFARAPLHNLTIPQKVTNVSICHNGPGYYVVLSRMLHLDFGEFTFHALGSISARTRAEAALRHDPSE